MTAIWKEIGGAWRLASPAGFDAETALHDLVEQSPQLLPLAGSPQLVVLGREVRCGGGYADLIAVEPSGRLALIEVKLKKNTDRRAVIAQLLSYAASLHGLSVGELEEHVLRPHLNARGYTSITDAVASNDQEGVTSKERFDHNLAESLVGGGFRLVVVLDEAPPDLVRMVRYLEAVADGLVIDLVTVTPYDIDGSRILVPQRVEPERLTISGGDPPTVKSTREAVPVQGTEEFAASIEQADQADRPGLRQLLDWATSLENEGLAQLYTTVGKERWALNPRVAGDSSGLVTIWNESGPYLTVWRGVFERRGALQSLQRLEKLLAPSKVGQGTKAQPITDGLLGVLTQAYREAIGS